MFVNLTGKELRVTGTETRNVLVEVVYQTIRATVAKQKSLIQELKRSAICYKYVKVPERYRNLRVKAQ